VGLDAAVHCRCWQDGLVTPPPGLAGSIGFDDEGWLGVLPEHSDEEWWAVEQWLADACPHRNMRQASERVSNWSGVRQFQTAMSDLGWEHFPTLKAELPGVNGGMMPAAAATRVLGELEHFERHATSEGGLSDDVVLCDEADGAVVLEYVAAYDGVTLLGPRYRAGVDPDGFFVRDPGTDPPETLFRAMRFRQRMLGDRRLELSDGATVRVVEMPAVGRSRDRVPESFRVESRPRTAADFVYILEPLRELCRASVETGNPVVWK
jgi:hypothetical protein